MVLNLLYHTAGTPKIKRNYDVYTMIITAAFTKNSTPNGKNGLKNGRFEGYSIVFSEKCRNASRKYSYRM
jgi:hypothetical protein